MEGRLFLKDARQEFGSGLAFEDLPGSHTFFDPFASLDDDDGADFALARVKTTSERP